jgi:transposase
MGDLRMSLKERIRLDAVSRIARKELTVLAAAEHAGLSVRQMRRCWKRYQAEGDAGLVHRLRGRSSNHRLEEATASVIVKLKQEHYHDYGPTLTCEKLLEKHQIKVSPNTLTRLLKDRGLWERRRRRRGHRSRRERRASFGSLVQMDGSEHDWLEGRGGCGKLVLMVLIDDATNHTYARFYRSETMGAAFDALGRWVRQHGLPRGVYVDQDSIYRNATRPELATQFGRAMQELGVELICAHSPQAKGRVERRNGVLQDRLVKELRERNIRDMDQANAVLESYLPWFNRKFALAAASNEDLHRPVPAEVVLEEVLCEQDGRVVSQDWCVRWKNRWLQIEVGHASLMLPRRRVLVKELADGRLLVEHQGQKLRTREIPSRPVPAKAKRPIVNNRRRKPDANHPWNRTRPGQQPSGQRVATLPAPMLAETKSTAPLPAAAPLRLRLRGAAAGSEYRSKRDTST